MNKYFRKNRHAGYAGISKNFQGFGVVFSWDNPTYGFQYFLFEFRFLWLKIWYAYELKKKLNHAKRESGS